MVAPSIVLDLPQSFSRSQSRRFGAGVESMTVIRLVVLEHPEQDVQQLSSCCHRCLLFSPFLLNLGVELRQLAVRIESFMGVNRFGQNPSQMLRTFLVDRPVMHRRGGLADRRGQPSIGREMLQIGETVDVGYLRPDQQCTVISDAWKRRYELCLWSFLILDI